VEIIKGRSSVFICDVNPQHDESVTEYYLKPSLTFNRLLGRRFLITGESNYYFNLYGRKVMLLCSPPVEERKITSTDLIIITGNRSLELEKILVMTHPSLIVFDATNSAHKVAKWKKTCNEAHIRYHDVAEKGAFIINLNSLSFATP
jgi:hypothetical protein